jgi:hypothetical protein
MSKTVLETIEQLPVHSYQWDLNGLSTSHINTSNARPRTRLALSRRNSTSELSANYLLIKFRKTDLRFEFLDRDYLWSNFIKKKLFRKKPILCVKKSIRKKFKKN